MKYRKPELSVLGAATVAVQSCPNKSGPLEDNSGGCGTMQLTSGINAYDADE
jgi:hypothetical protein